jgi:hypothetical protein
MTSILRDFHHTIPLKYCQVGLSKVKLRLFLSTGIANVSIIFVYFFWVSTRNQVIRVMHL